jgi:hypothetical protein
LELIKTVHETYDHIVAILVVGLIFVGAVLILPKMSFSNIQSVDYQQLRNTALNVFNTILLDSGEPSDWGGKLNWSPELVARFGLANSEASKFYVLDPEKVQRLKVGNPLGELSHENAKDLLNLEGYGFNLRIIPPFNVTDSNGNKINATNSPIDRDLLSQGKCHYAVKVSFLDGRPIANADIKALAVYTDGTTFQQKSQPVKQTDPLGTCSDTIELGGVVPDQIIIILRIDVAEVASLVVTFGRDSKDSVAINMVGDNIILTKPDNIETGATVFINGIYLFKNEDIITMITDPDPNKFTYTESGSFENWTRNIPGIQSFEPTLIIVSCSDVPKDELGQHGRRDIIVAGPYQNLLGFSIFEYGPKPQDNNSVVRLQRNVIISGMTYTAELIFWKES